MDKVFFKLRFGTPDDICRFDFDKHIKIGDDRCVKCPNFIRKGIEGEDFRGHPAHFVECKIDKKIVCGFKHRED